MVGGWLTRVGKYTVDQVSGYLEVDSWIPTELAPFLSRVNELVNLKV